MGNLTKDVQVLSVGPPRGSGPLPRVGSFVPVLCVLQIIGTYLAADVALEDSDIAIAHEARLRRGRRLSLAVHDARGLAGHGAELPDRLDRVGAARCCAGAALTAATATAFPATELLQEWAA